MKKQLVSILITSSILLSGAAVMPEQASAQTIQTARVVKSVSFREQPSTNAERIRYLSEGEAVTIFDKVNAYWFQVKDKNGIMGYVSTSSEYLASNWTPPVLQGTNATVLSSVAFRVRPEVSSDLIRYLKSGEQLIVLEKVNSYWYKVRAVDGKTGYVSTNSKYISTTYKEPAPPVIPKDVAVQKIIAAGKKYIGTPYEFGSSRANTDTFDCSDFVRQAFLDGIGLKLPADSRSQGAYVKEKGNIKTKLSQLEPGDIMFFMEYKGSSASNYSDVDKMSERITHNGIYIGDGKILQTYSKETGGVRIDTIVGSQWEKRFLFGGSPL